MPGVAQGAKDTEVNPSGKPGASPHGVYLPVGVGGRQETIQGLDKIPLVVMRVQKQANMACAGNEGRSGTEEGGWLEKECPGDTEVEVSQVRRIQQCKEPEEKCSGRKEPRVKRCPGRHTLYNVEEMALNRALIHLPSAF